MLHRYTLLKLKYTSEAWPASHGQPCTNVFLFLDIVQTNIIMCRCYEALPYPVCALLVQVTTVLDGAGEYLECMAHDKSGEPAQLQTNDTGQAPLVLKPACTFALHCARTP